MKKGGINYLIIALFLFVACKSQPTAVVETEKVDTRPEWVRIRPANPAFYIGISGASKKNSQFDYAQNAKARALEDLASGIKVNVESSSILFQLERNNSFKDSYESVIKSKTSQELEEFELVDSWETETEYWVYYRLSKEKFKAQQQKKRETAQNLSFDLFKKAKEFESKGQVLTALSTYLNALKSLQEYLGDLNKVEYEGKQIYLGTEIYNAIQVLMREIKISSSPELSYKRGVTRDKKIIVTVTYKQKQLMNIPLTASFTSGKGTLSDAIQTNEKGQATFILSSVSSLAKSQAISIELDLEKLKSQDVLNKALLKTTQSPSQLISLAVSGPTIYFKTREKNLGKTQSSTLIKDYLIKNIVNQGFTVSSSSSSADLVCTIAADTKKGADNSGIFSTYLTVSFTVKDKKSYKIIYSGKLIDVKGVQLDFSKAGEDAYKKSLKQIDKKILPEMQQVVFE